MASLGYFAPVKNEVLIEPLENENNRYTMQYYTTDGVNVYNVGSENACLELNSSNGEKEYLVNHWDLIDSCFNEIGFPLATTYHLLVAIDPVEEEKLTSISFDSINPESPKKDWT